MGTVDRGSRQRFIVTDRQAECDRIDKLDRAKPKMAKRKWSFCVADLTIRVAQRLALAAEVRRIADSTLPLVISAASESEESFN
jgi:hypothetical protein